MSKPPISETPAPKNEPVDAFDAVIASGNLPEEIHIRLTDRALVEAEKMALENEEYKNRPVRIYLDGKGCDGFFYGVTFDEKLSSDIVFYQGSIELVVDPETLRFTAGSFIDWVDDDRGRGFLVNNPKHSKYRGKFYKRSSWQDLLLKKTKVRATPQPSA